MIRPCPGRGSFFSHIISGRSCWILRRTSTARVAIRISRFMSLSILYWRRYILLASWFLHRSRSFPFSLPVHRPVLFTTSRPRPSLPLQPSETLSLVVIVDTTTSWPCYQRHIGIDRCESIERAFFRCPCSTLSGNPAAITSREMCRCSVLVCK